MRSLKTFLGLAIVTFAVAAQSQNQPKSPMLKKSFMQMSQAATWRGVNIVGYDCSIPTVEKNKGKCNFAVEVGGEVLGLWASPEVAAPWGNSYGPDEFRPMRRLTVIVLDDEVLSVRDSSGKTISTKFDYSR